MKKTSKGKSGKPVILCIDDDKDFLDSLKMIIEAGGYRIETATSGEEGLKKYKAAKPALVIVDLMMESVDSGVQLSQSLKENGYAGPMYLLSSAGDAVRFNLDPRELGLAGIFQKPIQHDLLVRTLKSKLHIP